MVEFEYCQVESEDCKVESEEYLVEYEECLAKSEDCGRLMFMKVRIVRLNLSTSLPVIRGLLDLKF